jgi:hypothetical protein
MNRRTLGLAIGSAITTFLLVGAATIELLGAGEAPGIGIVGVFVGVVAGLIAGGVVSGYGNRVAGLTERALIAYATFGIVFVGLAGIRYVNVPGADDVITFPVQIGVSVLGAVALAVVGPILGEDRTR